MSHIILTGTTNPLLAKAIARAGKYTFSCATIERFSDGELYVRVPPVRGRDIIVVQSGTPDAQRATMELLFLLDAVERSGATSVTVVFPFVPYRRQERQAEEGEAIGGALCARLLESFRLQRIIVVAPHTARSSHFFHIPFCSVDTLPLFVAHLRQRVQEKSEWVVVAPDRGGMPLAKALARALSLPLVCMEKRRRVHDRVAALTLKNGAVKGKHAIILDDEIDTGGTMVKNVYCLRQHGIRDIILAATHAVFSGNAPALLARSPTQEVVVTDTIAIPREKHFAKLTVLSAASLIVEALPNY